MQNNCMENAFDSPKYLYALAFVELSPEEYSLWLVSLLNSVSSSFLEKN